MRSRYLAVIPIGRAAVAKIERNLGERHLPPSFQNTFESDALVVFSDSRGRRLVSASCVILGELFARGRNFPEHSLGGDQWCAIESSGGRVLVERFWGPYVAFAIGTAGVRVIRAPFGDLGCYYALSSNALILASDLDLLLSAAQLGRQVNLPALARHIAFPECRTRETCLANVFELRGGECLHVSADGLRTEAIWSPWSFVTEKMSISDSGDAARRVGDSVRLSVSARIHAHKRSLLLLSGGLDSSIVASVLRQAEAEFSCLNLVAEDAASDEIEYAALVAKAVSAALDVRRFDLTRIRVCQSGAAHMPYPVHRCFTQAIDEVAFEAAAQCGADVVIDGGGGDNAFFATRSVSILADCLLTSGFDRRFWHAAHSLGDLAQTGIVALTGKAIGRAWRRDRAPRLPAQTEFLSSAAKKLIEGGAPHPFFCPPRDVLPGRAAHVALLTPAQNLVEALNAQALFASLSPLVSQPVVETCLRVPSWLWITPGRNRDAARRAFATDLPRTVIERRSKGSPTQFVATIFERNRLMIREMLLGGFLTEKGLIDTTAVAAALRSEGPTRDLRFARIMELVDAEAWARAQ